MKSKNRLKKLIDLYYLILDVQSNCQAPDSVKQQLQEEPSVYPHVVTSHLRVRDKKVTDRELGTQLSEYDTKEELTKLLSDLYLYPAGKLYPTPHGDSSEWSENQPTKSSWTRKREDHKRQVQASRKSIRELARELKLGISQLEELPQAQSKVLNKRQRRDTQQSTWRQTYV